MTVAVIGRFGRFSPTTADATLDAVVKAIRTQGHACAVIDTNAIVRGACTFDPIAGVLTVDDDRIAIDDLSALLLGPLPSPYARTAPGDVVRSAADHDTAQKHAAAKSALCWSFVLECEARGVRVLSSPSLARPFDHKPFQLAALSRAGLRIPDTIATAGCDVDAIDDGINGIDKPIIGGPVTLSAPSDAPRLVQRREHGLHVRVVVVDGEAIAATVVDVGDVLDSRNVDGAVPYSLDPELRDVARRAALCCHYDVCAIDLVQTRAGLIVLDVNRTPQVMDVAEITGVRIADDIARCVLRAAGAN